MSADNLQSSAQARNLAAANTKFAMHLYQQISNSSTDNIFVSPFSISVALAMTYLGARGNTMKQMDTLRFNEIVEEELHQTFSDVVASLKNTGGNYTLHIANCLYGEKSYKFFEEFISLGKKNYGAELAAVDFVHDASGAVGLINGWVSKQTNQKIPEVVPPDAVNELTRLILGNAIYFKGDWNKKFDKAKTEDKDFRISKEKSVKVPLMHMPKFKVQYGVNSELNCQTIELPYNKHALSMFVLLPDDTVTSLQEVESKLTSDHLINVGNKFHMGEKEVHVWLPRFKLDEKLSLDAAFSIMGMDEMFSMDKADFSGIDGTKELYVSQVFHRAFVEVNEEGSEAAAATAVVMMTRCAMIPRDPVEFKADHPFLFFIRDNVTGSILFLGRLVNL